MLSVPCLLCRHASMLSIKLAQIQQKGIVVSVHTDPSSISSHSDLLVMFGLGHRNLVCYNKVYYFTIEMFCHVLKEYF